MNNSIINQSIVIMLIFLLSIPALHSQVVINEIGWMGTAASSADEWIELYNFSQLPVNLTGWHLQSDDESPSVSLAGTVNAGDYYLLERTDDNTILNIPADKIYTGALGNTGENLSLTDNTSTTIDQVSCSAGWFAGKNSDKTSMERIDPGTQGPGSDNWGNNNHAVINGRDADNQIIYATPGARNSIMDASLPVRITDFQAQPEPDCIRISWCCPYPDGVSNFNLFRSINNKDYTNIADIPADPNQKQYDYIDKEIDPDNTYHYKLQLIQDNGTGKYYGPVEILIKKKGKSSLRIFPTPFNPTTTLYITLAESDWSSTVNCTIFNCLGQKIRTYSDTINGPGHYTLTWNGRDSKGTELPSGIYVAKLFSAKGVLASSRILKLK